MMSHFGQCAVYVVFAGTLFMPAARAQYTADFQTNIISGVNSNWSGDYYIGSNTLANVLLIQNGGALSNGNSFLAYDSINTRSNKVVVSGTGSVWSNTSDVYVGYWGRGNSLVISNGGQVVSPTNGFGTCYIGYNSPSSSNNVLVTGTGSVWKCGFTLYAGRNGGGNSVVVSNGGQLVAVATYIYSSNNRMVVTGPGSMFSNSGCLSFGITGASAIGNTTVISDGGKVINVGQFAGGGVGGTNNSVLITGTGSVWSSSRGISVSGVADSLIVRDGGSAISSNGGIGQGFSAPFPFPSFNSDSNTVLVTGTSSVWSNSGTLTIGSFGSGNGLVVSNGGQVVSGTVFEGATNASNGNVVRVVDNGVWRSDILRVGNQGSSNSLVVGGGSVFATDLTIGFNSSTCDNWVQLDSGSVVVTNATTNAVLEVRRGKFILNGGVLQADKLVMTNACGLFVRAGGTLIYDSAVLATNLDADGDGISNGYEQGHSLDPLNAADANVDTDGDGFTNLQEFQAGTNPTNASSAFRVLSLESTNNDILVTWQAGGGRTNMVQSAPDLAGSYTNVSPNIVLTGSGDVTTNYLDAGGATNASSQFYHIRLVP